VFSSSRINHDKCRFARRVSDGTKVVTHIGAVAELGSLKKWRQSVNSFGGRREMEMNIRVALTRLFSR
jgi:hypothetical protein